MALIVPNTDAVAGKHESSASKVMIAIDRFDILIPPEEPPSGSSVVLVKQQTGLAPERKYPQRSLETAGTMAALGASSKAETMHKQANK
jgi:hypothetical protein